MMNEVEQKTKHGEHFLKNCRQKIFKESDGIVSYTRN